MAASADAGGLWLWPRTWLPTCASGSDSHVGGHSQPGSVPRLRTAAAFLATHSTVRRLSSGGPLASTTSSTSNSPVTSHSLASSAAVHHVLWRVARPFFVREALPGQCSRWCSQSAIREGWGALASTSTEASRRGTRVH